jgi:hypothetical protein
MQFHHRRDDADDQAEHAGATAARIQSSSKKKGRPEAALIRSFA